MRCSIISTRFGSLDGVRARIVLYLRSGVSFTYSFDDVSPSGVDSSAPPFIYNDRLCCPSLDWTQDSSARMSMTNLAAGKSAQLEQRSKDVGDVHGRLCRYLEVADIRVQSTRKSDRRRLKDL
jgi:hypothetical protein